MNVVKQALYSFMSKWHQNRNFNIKIRNIDCMYYEGTLVRKLPPGKRPTSVEFAIAELSLAIGYVDWSEMTPMKQDFMKLYNLMKKYIRGTACTYHAVAGFYNKYYESGSEANIMMNAVDEAYCYFECE